MSGTRSGADTRPYGLKVKQRQFKKGKCCACCGKMKSPREMTVDHIIPRSFGGDIYNTSNWQVLCQTCHQTKSRKEDLIRLGKGHLVADYFYEHIKGLKEFREYVESHGTFPDVNKVETKSEQNEKLEETNEKEIENISEKQS